MSSSIRTFGLAHVKREAVAACGVLVLGVAAGVVSAMLSSSGQETAAAAFEEMSIVAILALFFLIATEIWSCGKKPPKQERVLLAEPTAEEKGEAATAPATEEQHMATANEIGILSMKVRAFVETGELSAAEEAMERLQERGGQPGHVQKVCWTLSYSELIHAFARQGDAKKAEEWLDTFARAAPAIRPTTSCVNAVLGAVASQGAGAAARADALLARMVAVGVQPDEASYAPVLEACSREEDVHRAMRCRRAMRLAGLQTKSECYRMLCSPAAEKSAPRGPMTPPQRADSCEWRASDAGSSNAETPSWSEEGAQEAQEMWGTDANAEEWSARKWGNEKWSKRRKDWSDWATTGAESTQEQWSVPEEALNFDFGGAWEDEDGEVWDAWAQGDSWTCMKQGTWKEFAITYDSASNVYWWGSDLFADPSEGRDGLVQISWYAGSDLSKSTRWPAWTWYKCVSALSESEASHEQFPRWKPKAKVQSDEFAGHSAASMKWVPKSQAMK